MSAVFGPPCAALEGLQGADELRFGGNSYSVVYSNSDGLTLHSGAGNRQFRIKTMPAELRAGPGATLVRSEPPKIWCCWGRFKPSIRKETGPKPADSGSRPRPVAYRRSSCCRCSRPSR